jgi:hypothetical protein
LNDEKSGEISMSRSKLLKALPEKKKKIRIYMKEKRGGMGGIDETVKVSLHILYNLDYLSGHYATLE